MWCKIWHSSFIFRKRINEMSFCIYLGTSQPVQKWLRSLNSRRNGHRQHVFMPIFEYLLFRWAMLFIGPCVRCVHAVIIHENSISLDSPLNPVLNYLYFHHNQKPCILCFVMYMYMYFFQVYWIRQQFLKKKNSRISLIIHGIIYRLHQRTTLPTSTKSDKYILLIWNEIQTL